MVTGATPVPVTAADRGAVRMGALTDSVPLTAPATVGANPALMVQEAPPARELPQVLVWEKPVLNVMPNAWAVVPLLATVKVLTALVTPIATLPKLCEAGVIVMGAIPVPLTVTVSGLPSPL
jgi:hypothetical protein